MPIPLAYSYRNLRVRLAATLATMSGIVMLVFVGCASLMLAAGVRRAMLDSSSDDRAIVLQADALSEDGSRLRQASASLVAAAPGVAHSGSGTPLVAGESIAQLPFEASGSKHVASLQVRGLGEASLQLRPPLHIMRGRAARAGTAEAMVGAEVAGRYVGLDLGETFTLQKGRPLSVVGVFDTGGTAYDSEIWVDGDALRTALGWSGSLSSITAQLTSPDAFAAFAAQLTAEHEQGLSVERERGYYARLGSSLASLITQLGGLIGLVVALAAALGAMITMDAAVAQRRREIGVLMALGFSAAQVLSAFLIEAATIGALGASLGLGLALLTPLADFTTTNAATGQDLVFHFVPSAHALLIPLLFGTLIGVVGGFGPALRAARSGPLMGMRD